MHEPKHTPGPPGEATHEQIEAIRALLGDECVNNGLCPDETTALARYMAQRDELLKACRSLMHAFDPEWPGACVQECYDTSDGHAYELQEGAKAAARAAIAKAEESDG